VGVETLLGCVELGDYEILSAPVFFLNDDVKWVIFSDIDDTIKDSNIAQTTSFSKIIGSIFRGHYYSYDAIGGMAELYQKIVSKGGMVIYLTSTPFQLAPFLLKFLRQSGFPEGPVFPRWLGYGKFSHKWRILTRILSQVQNQKCFLIGDSGEQDLLVYRRVCETLNYQSKISRILIRHVPGTPRQRSRYPHERFYGDLDELKAELSPELGFLL
jgi:phosphatidate phosphatase APP1